MAIGTQSGLEKSVRHSIRQAWWTDNSFTIDLLLLTHFQHFIKSSINRLLHGNKIRRSNGVGLCVGTLPKDNGVIWKGNSVVGYGMQSWDVDLDAILGTFVNGWIRYQKARCVPGVPCSVGKCSWPSNCLPFHTKKLATIERLVSEGIRLSIVPFFNFFSLQYWTGGSQFAFNC